MLMKNSKTLLGAALLTALVACESRSNHPPDNEKHAAQAGDHATKTTGTTNTPPPPATTAVASVELRVFGMT